MTDAGRIPSPIQRIRILGRRAKLHFSHNLKRMPEASARSPRSSRPGCTARLETNDRLGKAVTAELPLQVLDPEAKKLNLKIAESFRFTKAIARTG